MGTAMTFTFDSVVFNTSRLADIRAFYEGKLGFPTGTYKKNGEVLPDYSDQGVNYHVGGGLIGFELENGKELNSSPASLADLVLRVSNLAEFKEKVKEASIPIVREASLFFMINDPEGRTLIFESV
jgi:hypothetical protein